MVPLTTEADLKTFRSCYIWYDYFGVPQMAARTEGQDVKKELQDAVMSIPAYIQRCEYFVVLAPVCQHTDLEQTYVDKSTWNTRGWCRAEMAVWALSPHNSDRMLTIIESGTLIEAHPLQWLFSLPTEGNFAVETDRTVVSDLFKEIVQSRLKAEKDVFYFRFIKAASAHMFSAQELTTNMETWLEEYKFKNAKAAAEHGFCPLHFAALEGNVAMIQSLIGAGCSVDVATLEQEMNIFAAKGMTPLMTAAMYIPIEKTNKETCDALIKLKADLLSMNEAKQQALHLAAMSSGGAETIDLLLDMKADINVGDKDGDTPLIRAVMGQSPTLSTDTVDNVKRLLKRRADPLKTNSAGLFPMTWASASGTDGVRALIEGRADVNQRIESIATRVSQSFMPVITRLVSMDKGLQFFGTHMYRMPCLFIHAMMGNPETLKMLLQARANPKLKNGLGHDVMQLGKMRGFNAETLKLLEDGSRHFPDEQ